MFAKVLLTSLLLLSLGVRAHAEEQPQPASPNVFVQLFEWTWNDIAGECETFLGPHGYTAVQISPPNEHRVLLGRPWYERYQPVSYRLTSRSGTRDELARMIQRCSAAGVGVYADVVINHMASCRPACDQAQPQIGSRSIAGRVFEPSAADEPRFTSLFDPHETLIEHAVDAYGPEHFHRGCNRISDWHVTKQVEHCELERLADLATEREDVQSTVASYLASLLRLGIIGFRIDAAKHIAPTELRNILQLAAMAANVHIWGTDINLAAPRTVLVFQEILRPTPRPIHGRITDFNFGRIVAQAFLPDGRLDALVDVLPTAQNPRGFIPSDRAIAFIDNHDTQRNRGPALDLRNHPEAYVLANVLMLAWPYGYPSVMSSYAFGDGSLWYYDRNPAQVIRSIAGLPVDDFFQGPPHLNGHRSVLAVKDYPDAFSWHTMPTRCGSGPDAAGLLDEWRLWICEHRLRPIAAMVAFRRALDSHGDPVERWWSNPNGSQIAFARGRRGFVAINAAKGSIPQAFGFRGDGSVLTGLPTGQYCDMIQSHPSSDKTRCVGPTADVLAIRVDDEGVTYLPVPVWGAMAIHVDFMLRSPRQ